MHVWLHVYNIFCSQLTSHLYTVFCYIHYNQYRHLFGFWGYRVLTQFLLCCSKTRLKICSYAGYTKQWVAPSHSRVIVWSVQLPIFGYTIYKIDLRTKNMSQQAIICYNPDLWALKRTNGGHTIETGQTRKVMSKTSVDAWNAAYSSLASDTCQTTGLWNARQCQHQLHEFGPNESRWEEKKAEVTSVREGPRWLNQHQGASVDSVGFFIVAVIVLFCSYWCMHRP